MRDGLFAVLCLDPMVVAGRGLACVVLCCCCYVVVVVARLAYTKVW